MAAFTPDDSVLGYLSEWGFTPLQVTDITAVCANNNKQKLPKKGAIQEALVKMMRIINTIQKEEDKFVLKMPPTTEVAPADESFHSAELPTTQEEGGNKAGGVEEKEKKENKDICRYYVKGLCRHGSKGKNREGTCTFFHPQKCKLYRLGGNTSNGCTDAKCKKLHPTICPSWKKQEPCNRGEECKKLHPALAYKASQPRKGKAVAKTAQKKQSLLWAKTGSAEVSQQPTQQAAATQDNKQQSKGSFLEQRLLQFHNNIVGEITKLLQQHQIQGQQSQGPPGTQMPTQMPPGFWTQSQWPAPGAPLRL